MNRKKNMPRPKSELTKSGRAIGVRVTELEYQEWIKLGGTKWLRAKLKANRQKSLNDKRPETLPE